MRAARFALAVVMACGQAAVPPHNTAPRPNGLHGYDAAVAALREAREHFATIPVPKRGMDRIPRDEFDELIARIDAASRHLGSTRPAPAIDIRLDNAGHLRRARELITDAMERIRDDEPGPATGDADPAPLKVAMLDKLAMMIKWFVEPRPDTSHPAWGQIDNELYLAHSLLEHARDDHELADDAAPRATLAALQENTRAWQDSDSGRSYTLSVSTVNGKAVPPLVGQALGHLVAAKALLAARDNDRATRRMRDEATAHVVEAMRLLGAGTAKP